MNRHLNFMLQGDWVIASHNHFHLSWTYVFSCLIMCYQLILRKKHWRYHHMLRVSNGECVEMVAAGRTTPSLASWLGKHERTIRIYRVPGGFPVEPKAMRYGVFDIVQITLHHIRKALGIGHGWNGKDGIPRQRAGHFCSEETLEACGRTDAHRRLPCEGDEVEELEYVATWRTFKDAFAKYYQPA